MKYAQSIIIRITTAAQRHNIETHLFIMEVGKIIRQLLYSTHLTHSKAQIFFSSLSLTIPITTSFTTYLPSITTSLQPLRAYSRQPDHPIHIKSNYHTLLHSSTYLPTNIYQFHTIQTRIHTYSDHSVDQSVLIRHLIHLKSMDPSKTFLLGDSNYLTLCYINLISSEIAFTYLYRYHLFHLLSSPLTPPWKFSGYLLYLPPKYLPT